jgi:uncharacterized protein (DUF427 family)
MTTADGGVIDCAMWDASPDALASRVVRTSRHLIASHGDRIVADTHARLVLYESGFAPRWYAPRAAWSYRAPFEEVTRIAELVSFYPAKVTVAIDRKRLEEAPPQNVIAHEDVFAADA